MSHNNRSSACWYSSVATGLIITVFAASSANGSSSRHELRERSGQPASTPQIADPATATVGYTYPYSCSRPKDAEQDNICVARHAADAAWESAHWARRTFWVGLSGTLAVICTLAATAWAAWAAHRSADAALRASDTAEKALLAGQRAFVSASFMASAVKNITTGRIDEWQFTPIWRNSGQTPTRDLLNHVSLQIFSDDLPEEWTFPDLWGSQSERDIVRTPLGAPPQGTVHGQTVSVTTRDMIKVVSGEAKLYMWGWATYHDVLPNTLKHVTRFAVQIVVTGDGINPEKTSVNFHYLRKYNCTDEECEYQNYPATWIAPQRDVVIGT